MSDLAEQCGQTCSRACQHPLIPSLGRQEDCFRIIHPTGDRKTWGELGRNILHANFFTSKLCLFGLVQNEIPPRSAGWQTKTWTLLLHGALAGFKFHLSLWLPPPPHAPPHDVDDVRCCKML